MPKSEAEFEIIETGGASIKAWTRGVPLEDEALAQLRNAASLPFIHRHVAAMPDVHLGLGAAIGSVIPCQGAVVPAAVGVDIGCGMMAAKTSLEAKQLPSDLHALRQAIELSVPHGRTRHGGKGDRGAWHDIPAGAVSMWSKKTEQGSLAERLEKIAAKHPKIGDSNSLNHLGTLGTGNHFIEICLDEKCLVWAMLHSGSRGVGNRIGSYFIAKAKEEMQSLGVSLPDKDLAYLREGTPLFNDYLEAACFAQDFALANRQLMMDRVLGALRGNIGDFQITEPMVNCHHNYVALERHFGADAWIARKGAVRAGQGELGIIPGSMGAKSFIVRGKGNPDSFCSCSHGAGRAMSRNEAKRRFSLADHAKATEGIECRKDKDVLDETPGAYKDIDAVMRAQSGLVEIVHTLKQVLCVKG